MNILVTGATGYIGSKLISTLMARNGFVLTCLVREGNKTLIDPSVKQLSFSSIDDLKKQLNDKKFDLILHLATFFTRKHCSEDLENLINSNVLLGTVLLESCKNGSAFINTDTYFYKEFENETFPESLYAATKSAFKEILKFYSISKELKTLNLSLTDTYGPNDKRDKLINLIAKAINSNEKLIIQNPDREINLLHVDDVIDAIVFAIDNIDALLESDRFRSYGLRAVESEIIRDIIFKIGKTKSVSMIEMGPKQETKKLDYLKFHQLPGWKPKHTSLNEGIISILSSC